MHDYYADDHERYQSGGVKPQPEAHAGEELPPYGTRNEEAAAYSKYDPRGWSLKNKIFLGTGTVVVIVAVVVGSVLGVRANRYPDYSKLDYTMKDNFSGTSFFDNFEYFTGADPAHGFVQYDSPTWTTFEPSFAYLLSRYISRANAKWLNLTHASSESAVLKVDTTLSGTQAASGRQSVRITSNKTYADGLFIFDILHTPYGCGTWPALWLTDPSNWPDHGEIDVVEAANSGTFGNQATLHTSDGCSMGVKRKETGSVQNKNCYYKANEYSGCGVTGPDSTYGPEFNKNGGGVRIAQS